MKAMDIYIANVPFDDQNKSKVQPALVVEVNKQKVGIFKVTSKFKNKSSKIKSLYCPISE